MRKLSLVILSIAVCEPGFLAAGYKWGERQTARSFLTISSYEDASDTKMFTKMGVMLHDGEIDDLSKYVSLMAQMSYENMLSKASTLNISVDSEADEYFKLNRSKLAVVAP